MKQNILLSLGFASVLGLNAQTDLVKQPCNTYNAMEEAFIADPQLKLNYESAQAQFEIQYQQAIQNLKTQKASAGVIYTIPVVFHIMGTGHQGSVTDAVFTNLITYLNNDFAKTGNDVASISPTFSSLYVDAEIRFALAKKDPLGNCTNGIIRHTADSKTWSQTSPNYAYSGTGTNRWPVNKYLNIYIVDCISSGAGSCPQSGGQPYVAGYTYLPGSSPGTNADAIVLLSFNGALAQNNPNDSRTISHEIGHWLNLAHTFGSTNNPGTTCGDDGVTDTPITKGILGGCPSSNSNSCAGSGNIWNVENIMDYSGCPKMFTQLQVTRMRTALTSSIAGRNNLWTTANLLATGITPGYTCAPVANFDNDKQVICSGQSVNYTNTSQTGASSGSIAWTFQNGSPATSTSTSQVVTYNTPGTYSVSITASNANGNNTLNKVSYITVLNGGSTLFAPITEDFEAASLSGGLSITNLNAASVAWEQNTTTGGNSTAKSIYLNNASLANTGGHLDIFETPTYNFNNTTNVGLSYWYAYARKLATQTDTFRVQYSLDCGGSWISVLGVPSLATMAVNSGGTTTTPLVPTAAQWKQTTISPVLLSALANKPSVKFRFYFRSSAVVGSSNNIYIDQINLSGTVGLNELESQINLSVYPNPTNASSKVSFLLNASQTAKVSVLDITGRILEETTKFDTNGSNAEYTINKNNALAKGIYIVNVEIGGQQISKKLIIE